MRLGLVGDTEQWLAEMPALQVEDKLMGTAKTARLAGDVAMPGPHASDVQAVHLASQTPAYLASTGQQKALLIAVVLAHARLQERRLGAAPAIWHVLAPPQSIAPFAGRLRPDRPVSGWPDAPPAHRWHAVRASPHRRPSALFLPSPSIYLRPATPAFPPTIVRCHQQGLTAPRGAVRPCW